MPSGVTMREILRLPPLAHARLLAGAAGLDRRVVHVNVMEVPDILRWVEPDELLLTTAYPLRDDRVALAELVPGLAQRGLAGLALKPARYIEAVPAEMVDAADRLAFPLLELPPDSSFNDIINAVLTVILNAQAARLQRTAEIHQRFTAIVLGGGGLREIAEALSDSIGRPVAIVDGANVLQTVAGAAERLGRPGSALEIDGPGDAVGAARMRRVALDGDAAVIAPIQVGVERFGAILALGGDPELSDDETDAIEYAATVAALRQVQARAVAEADRRFQAVCLEELVTGHVDRAALAERAIAFKWDLSVPRAVVLCQIVTAGGLPFARLAGRPEEATTRHRVADAVRTSLGRTAIAWERTSDVAALVTERRGPGGAGGAGLGEIVRRLVADVRRVVPDADVSVGVGSLVADPLQLARSFTEARRALEVGRRAGTGAVTMFGELGALQLLVALPPAQLREFAASQLGAVLAYDARHRADLLRTLEAWLATRNAALAARQLFVHYNTLKNRFAKLELLLGPFQSDPERCLALELALRIHRLPDA